MTLVIMMNKVRSIFIKDPQLRKIRKNLRDLIIAAVWQRVHDVMESDWKQYQELDQALNKSICRCASCKQSDLDMTYSPRFKKWFCFICYDRGILPLEKLTEQELIRLE